MDSTISDGSPGPAGNVMMTSCGPPGAYGVSSSPTSSSSSSSTSSPTSSSSAQAQYLNPDYVQPLTSSLDAKNSPLALLAQTCSSIGRDITSASSSATKGNHLLTSSIPVSISGGHHTRESSVQLSASGATRNKCTLSPLGSGKTSSQQLHKSGGNSGGVDRKSSNGLSSRPTGNINSGELSASASSPSSSRSKLVGSGAGSGSSARIRNGSDLRTGSSSSASSGGVKSEDVSSPSPTAMNNASSAFGIKSSSSGTSSSRHDTSGHQMRYSLNDEYQSYYNNNNTHSNNLFPFGSDFGSSSSSFEKFLLPSLDGQSGTTLQQLHLQHQAARYQNEALAFQAAIQAALYSSSPLAALYGSSHAAGPPTATTGSAPGLGGIPNVADQASLQAAAVYSAGLQAAAAAAAASGLYPPVARSDLYCTASSAASTGSPCTVPGCGCANVGVDAMSHLRYSTCAASLFQPPSSSLMSGLFSGGPSSASAMGGASSVGGPYSCSWLQQSNGEFCGRRFSTSVELLDHLRTHAASAQSTAPSQTSPVDSRRSQRSPRPSSPSTSSFHGHRPLTVPPLLPPLPPPPGLGGYPSSNGYPPSASALFDRLTTGSGRPPSPSSLFHASRQHAAHQSGSSSAGSRRDALSPSSLLFHAVSSSSSSSNSSLSRYHPYRFSQTSSSSSPVIGGGSIGSGLLAGDPVSPGSFIPGGMLPPPPPIPSSLMAAYLSSPYAATLYNSQRLGPAVGP